MQACAPASFGRGGHDILDEDYRKAGKLDTQYFAPKFDPERYDLLDIVQDNLLDSADASQHIRAELYKLNVYGRSSFLL